MKIQDIRKIAKKMDIKSEKLDKGELIRAIQKTEGNYDCFGTPYASQCGQTNCLWRSDCVKTV